MTERSDLECKVIKENSEGYARIDTLIEKMRLNVLNRAGIELYSPRISVYSEKMR